MKKNLLLALLTISLMSALAGCGGDDEKKGGSNAAPAAAPVAAAVEQKAEDGPAAAALSIVSLVDERYEEELSSAMDYDSSKYGKPGPGTAANKKFKQESPDNFLFDGGCEVADAVKTAVEGEGKFSDSIKAACEANQVSKSDCKKAVAASKSFEKNYTEILDACDKNESNPQAKNQRYGLGRPQTIAFVKNVVKFAHALEGSASKKNSK